MLLDSEDRISKRIAQYYVRNPDKYSPWFERQMQRERAEAELAAWTVVGPAAASAVGAGSRGAGEDLPSPRSPPTARKPAFGFTVPSADVQWRGTLGKMAAAEAAKTYEDGDPVPQTPEGRATAATAMADLTEDEVEAEPRGDEAYGGTGRGDPRSPRCGWRR